MLKTYYPCDIKLWFMYFVTNILPFHLCKNNDKKGEYINGILKGHVYRSQFFSNCFEKKNSHKML